VKTRGSDVIKKVGKVETGYPSILGGREKAGADWELLEKQGVCQEGGETQVMSAASKQG